MNPQPMTNGEHHESWRNCYRQLAPKLLLFARQWVPTPADAEDVVQSAFIKFWHRQPDARPEHYPLLYAAIRTTALDLLRGADRRLRRENNPDAEVRRDDDPFFDTTVEQRDTAAQIDAALRRLPPEQREVLVLRIWSGLTFAEIATTLDETINTVSSRYRYALAALRRQMNPHEYERV